MSDAETVERVARAMWESRNVSKWADAENTALINIYRNLARAAIAAMPSPTVQKAAKVLLDQTTIAEKIEMNNAGVNAMFPSGWEVSQKIAFDKGRIAALRALIEQEGE